MAHKHFRGMLIILPGIWIKFNIERRKKDEKLEIEINVSKTKILMKFNKKRVK
jgi:hypothetical protein